MDDKQSQADHDMLIRIETKLDSVLAWVKMHDTKHFRINLLVMSILITTLVGLVVLT